MRIGATAATGILLAIVALLCLPGRAGAAPATQPWFYRPLTDEAVDKAVRKGIIYLWNSRNKEGNWELQTQAEADAEMKDQGRREALDGPSVRGGPTALVLLALLKAGVSPEDPRFDAAMKWLCEQPSERVYTNALRAVLYASMNRPDLYRRPMEREKAFLLAAVHANGGFGYIRSKFSDNPGKCPNSPAPLSTEKAGQIWHDLSNTQYGVLGMWALSDAGVEIPDKFWKSVQGCYLRDQLDDGGWNYTPGRPETKSYHTMTLGALASLFIVWDKLHAANCNGPPPTELSKSIEDGLKWLGPRFFPTQWSDAKCLGTYYIAYGIERVGVASGLKYFGHTDWWATGGRATLHSQKPDGHWGEQAAGYQTLPVQTAFALLFLSYGRAPVVFNKLAYGPATQWNSRPRDLARLSLWLNRKYERLHNWQVMPIERPVSELLDAPILLMSGRGPIDLTDPQKRKLRQYVFGGGLLLGEAADNSKVFADAFRTLIRELFPEAELTRLPPDHPIYTVHYPIKPGLSATTAPALEGLGNGLRTMVLLSPGDLGCAWQRSQLATRVGHFELAANLVEYVSDKGAGLLGRGTSYMGRDHGFRPTANITVGRLAWSANRFAWDPEPAAWQRVDVKLRNHKVASVATTRCDLNAPVDPKAVPLMHVTGTTALKLTDAQQENLKQYVTGGGLLLADAAGGCKAFAESFDALMGKLFSPQVVADPPWLSDVADAKGTVQLRHVDKLPRASRPIQLMGCQVAGRWAVLSLPYDLTASLVSYPNLMPSGLSPASGEKFIVALISSLCGVRPTTVPD